MNDLSLLLDNKINCSFKKEIIKKKIDLLENKEDECYQYKKIQYETIAHNKHKKDRSKPLNCDLITNMEEFMSSQNNENVPYNKLDKYMKNRLIEEYIKEYAKENTINYQESSKIINMALINKKKIIYDIETKKIIKIG